VALVLVPMAQNRVLRQIFDKGIVYTKIVQIIALGSKLAHSRVDVFSFHVYSKTLKKNSSKLNVHGLELRYLA
jgi:hypothetical protein